MKSQKCKPHNLGFGFCAVFSMIFLFSINSSAQLDVGNFRYVRPVYLNTNNVTISDNVNNFPLLIRLYNGNNIDFGKLQADHGDLRITDADGYELPFEIESWTDNEVDLWVRVPSISPNNSDQHINLYYGWRGQGYLQLDTSASSVWGGSGTSNFMGVWHLSSASTSAYNGVGSDDSVISNCTDIVPGSIWDDPALINGEIGMGLHENGGGCWVGTGDEITSWLNYLDNPDNNGGYMNYQPLSLSCWVKVDTINVGCCGGQRPYASILSAGGGANLEIFDNNGTYSVFGTYLSQGYGGTVIDTIRSDDMMSNPLYSDWNYLTLTLDPNNSSEQLYLNGSLIASANYQDGGSGSLLNAFFPDQGMSFGSNETYQNDNNRFHGMTDEQRIDGCVESPDWITLSYYSQWPWEQIFTQVGEETGEAKLEVEVNGSGGAVSAGQTQGSGGFQTTITATPSPGYSFSHWGILTDDLGTGSIDNTTSPSAVVTVPAGDYMHILAYFSQIPTVLNLTKNGNFGTVTGQTQGYGPINTTITATPSVGYAFSGWTRISGNCTIYNLSSPSTTVSIPAGDNSTVQANFTALPAVLNLTTNGTFGTVDGQTQAPGPLNTPITATPSAGYSFSKWTIVSDQYGTASISDPTSSSTWVTIPPGDNVSIQAIFSIQNSPSLEDYSLWSNHQAFTLNTSASGANVFGNVMNFPVLVKLTAANAAIFGIAKSDGSDIRFSKADFSKQLSFQIDRWDRSNQTATIWVLLDTVYGNNSAQQIILHYGKSNVSSVSSSRAVFNSGNGFAAEFHLNGKKAENNTFPDATGNNTSGALSSSTVTDTDGIFDRAVKLHCSGGTDYLSGDSIYIPGLMGNPAIITLSAWVRVDSIDQANTSGNGHRANIISLGDNVGLSDGGAFGTATDSLYTSWKAGSTWNNFGWPSPSLSAPNNQGHALWDHTWKHVAAVISPANGYTKLYLNGTCIRNISAPSAITYNAGPTRTVIGKHGNGAAGEKFGGSICEVRFENVARSDDWMKLCYQNQQLFDPVHQLVQSGQIVSSGYVASIDVINKGYGNVYLSGSSSEPFDPSTYTPMVRTIIAEPLPGYQFSGWQVVGTSNGYSSYDISVATQYGDNDWVSEVTLNAAKGTPPQVVIQANFTPVDGNTTWDESAAQYPNACGALTDMKVDGKINITGSASLNSGLTVGGTGPTGATLHTLGESDFDGPTFLNCCTYINTDGGMNSIYAFNVKGNSNLQDVYVGNQDEHHDLSVTGSSFLGSASINNDLTVNGNASFNSDIVSDFRLYGDASLIGNISIGNSLRSEWGHGTAVSFASPVSIDNMDPDFDATNPLLSINGEVSCNSLRLNNWVLKAPDYVFEPDYKLSKLDNLEAYLKQYHHLPEVPSAEDLKKDGMDLAQFNMVLLKKIEELTLYTIEMKKEIETQNEIIAKLETQKK